MSHVRELAFFNGGWHTRDVTADTGAVPARAGAPLAGFTAGGADSRVYYIEDFGRGVRELAFFNSSWHPRNVGAETGAEPIANFRAMTAFTASGADSRVYYLDSASDVRELAFFNGGWHTRDVTADTGAEPAVPGSALAGFTAGGADSRVYYLDFANHVRELAFFNGGWHTRDVSADTGAKPAMSQSPLAGFTAGGADSRVYYLDSALHVRELAFFNGGWHTRDVTADTGAVPARSGSALAGFTAGGADSRVYYLDTNP
jgi:hypothetical protein